MAKKGLKINCKPLFAHWYYCIECEMITAFDGNAHCFVCGCDCPVGELNDYSITEQEWDEENRISFEIIGDIRELPKDHWMIKTIN